ncbi:hypothetical protein ES703_70662 [subsurface metagenome]
MAEKEKQPKVGNRVILLGRKGTIVRFSKDGTVVHVKWDDGRQGIEESSGLKKEETP